MKESEHKARIAPTVTPEFMATLREVVLFIGWSVDMAETRSLYTEAQREFGVGEPWTSGNQQAFSDEPDFYDE